VADELTMKPPRILALDTPEIVAEKAVQDFVAHVRETLEHKDRFSVALPGGATPKLFFSRLAQEPYRSEIPWDKIWVFWGDERCVPPEHPESNYGLARQLLLDKVPVKNSHVFRIRGEDPPAETARTYSKTLHDAFRMDGEWPAFDLIILGMGPDGHVASLMPGTAALQEERRWVVENVVRSLQTVRITMTLPVINRARHVWFLVTGVKKAPAFARAQGGPHIECPASLVHPPTGEVRWYVDKAVVEPPP
jgi:6-phosphogluconolactonase